MVNLQGSCHRQLQLGSGPDSTNRYFSHSTRGSQGELQRKNLSRPVWQFVKSPVMHESCAAPRILQQQEPPGREPAGVWQAGRTCAAISALRNWLDEKPGVKLRTSVLCAFIVLGIIFRLWGEINNLKISDLRTTPPPWPDHRGQKYPGSRETGKTIVVSAL